MERTVTIGNVEFDVSIFTEPFACNVAWCKGACCTIPDCYGAPLEEDELPVIEGILPQIFPLLSERAQQTVRQRGIAERAPNGEWVTTTVEGKECVFVCTEEGIAFCAFHRAWLMGAIEFPKPLSCHLFPLRRRASGFYYERYPECSAAVEYGRRTGSHVYDVARRALQRCLGDEVVQAADAMSMLIVQSEGLCRS